MAKKKVTDVLVGFVLDKSPSMSHLVPDTIKGFNTFLEEQQALDGDAYLSLTLFDQNLNVPLVAQEIKDCPQMGTVQLPYRIDGMGTALYDAVGATILGIEGWLKNNKTFKGEVVIVVWTDGEENMSRTWTLANLLAKIQEKRDAGWQFSFLGSGGSAWLEGQNFVKVFTPAHTVSVSNDSFGTANSYGAASMSLTSLRSTGNYTSTLDNYKRLTDAE